MTNKELQEILKQYPDDATVWIMDRKNDMTTIAEPEKNQFEFDNSIIPYHKEEKYILICVDERFE